MTNTTLDFGSQAIPARLATTNIIGGWISGAVHVLVGIAARQIAAAKRRRWRRRTINELRGLSNRTLNDIGLDRSMIVSTVLEREAALFGPAAE